MIKVLVAEDHAMMREGLCRIIDSHPGMVAIAEAVDGMDAIEKISSIKCDVIIMDMTMPKLGGIELIRQIRKRQFDLPILVMSMHDAGNIVIAALKAGANGYITKNTSPEQLGAILQTLVRGGHYVESELAMRTLAENPGSAQAHERLSEREMQVLLQIVTGKSTKQIAAEMYLSPKTISTHKKHIMEKMGVDNAADLVRYALEHHLYTDMLPRSSSTIVSTKE